MKLKSHITELIQRALRSRGFELHRLPPGRDAASQLVQALQHHAIDLVFDVGANTGQFATAIRAKGYRGQIVSFEPLQEPHRALRRAARKDPDWQIAARGAIGDSDGSVTINVSENSVSSSILPLLDTHLDAAAESRYVGTETVPIRTLDSIGATYLSDTARPFMKIDVQGLEWEALDGAREILPSVQGVVCETSLVALYQGERPWLEIVRRLEGEGFTLWNVSPCFSDWRLGRTLQVDLTFFRSDF